MSRFLKDTDYAVLIRTEIKNILLENYSETKLLSAEQMAIAQIKNYLAGRYDVALIFTPLPEPIEDDNSEQLDSRNSKSIGIQGFLYKPVVMSDLARCVRSVLDG